MSTSESGVTVRLGVSAEDRLAAISVADSAFEEVASGRGRIEVELPPGLYQVRVSGAGQSDERIVALRNEAVELRFGPLSFASAAPLLGTWKTREEHGDAAAAQSRAVHASKGTGGALFVFARHWSAEGPAITRPHPAADLTIHDALGKLVVNVAEQGSSELDASDPWCACNVVLDPGLFRLRVKVPSIGILEQAIVVSPGWQSQVFLLSRTFGDDPGSRRADLAGAAIFLLPLTAGFDPADPALRFVELARRLLMAPSTRLSRGDLEAMLAECPRTPMLGLLGAHLALLQEQPDRALLQLLIAQLSERLGAHPDVEVIALLAGARTPVFALPPMLLQGWTPIVMQTIRQANLLPRGSLAESIAGTLWGEGPWLVWRLDEGVGVSSSMENARGLRLRDDAWDMAFTIGLTAAEESVRSCLYPSLLTGSSWVYRRGIEAIVQRERGSIHDGQPLSEELVITLVRALGLPRLVLDDAVAELLLQLGPIPEAPVGGPLVLWPRGSRKDPGAELDIDEVEGHLRRLIERAEMQERPFLARTFLAAALFWQQWCLLRRAATDADQVVSEPLAFRANADAGADESAASRLEKLRETFLRFLSRPEESLVRRIACEVENLAPPFFGHYVLARIYSILGWQAAAEAAFAMAVLCEPFNTSCVVLLVVEQSRRDAEAALTTLTDARTALGLLPRLRVQRAHLLWQIWVRDGRVGAPPLVEAEDALTAVRGPTADDLTEAELSLGRLIHAFCVKAARGVDAAIPILEEATRDRPQGAHLWMALGTARLHAGLRGEATTAIFEQAAARAGEDTELRDDARRAAFASRDPGQRSAATALWARRYFERRFIPCGAVERAIDRVIVPG